MEKTDFELRQLQRWQEHLRNLYPLSVQFRRQEYLVRYAWLIDKGFFICVEETIQ